MGIGKAYKTTDALINDGYLFVIIEKRSNDYDENLEKQKVTTTSKSVKPIQKLTENNCLSINKITKDSIDINDLYKTFDIVVYFDELAFMAEMENASRKLVPVFESRIYGNEELKNLFNR